MTHDRFKELLEELDGNSVSTLAEKNARYSSGNDALHNFIKGGDVMGGTPAQACWGYLTKHLVALRDKVQNNDFSNREDFLEKCQDSINYIRFLWCIGNEENSKLCHAVAEPEKVPYQEYRHYVFRMKSAAYEFIDRVDDILAANDCVTINAACCAADPNCPLVGDGYAYGWKGDINYSIECKEGFYVVTLPEIQKL